MTDMKTTDIEADSEGKIRFKKGMFWQVNIGHVITVATILLGFAGTYFRFENRVANLEADRLKDELRLESVFNSGNATQKTADANTIAISSLDKRVLSAENQLHDLVPRVVEIDTNIKWMLKMSPYKGSN